MEPPHRRIAIKEKQLGLQQRLLSGDTCVFLEVSALEEGPLNNAGCLGCSCAQCSGRRLCHQLEILNLQF